MREEGFEPSQALSYDGLNVARLTAPAPPHYKSNVELFLKVCLEIKKRFELTSKLLQIHLNYLPKLQWLS